LLTSGLSAAFDEPTVLINALWNARDIVIWTVMAVYGLVLKRSLQD
jgi:hypothetical protein